MRDLAAVAEETTDVIIITDAGGKITWVNSGLTRRFGYSTREIINVSLADFFQSALTTPAKVAEIKSALAHGENYNGTILSRTKKGVSLWNEIKIKAVKDDKVGIQKFVLVEKDVSEHIKKNEELLYSELRWKFALEESGDGFFEYDLVTHKFFGSENLQELVTLNEDLTQLVFPALIDIIHPDDSEAAVSALFDLVSGRIEMLQQELRVKNKQGKYIWTNVRATISSKDAQGKPLMLIGTTTDISHIKKTEEELLKAKHEAERASEYKNQFLSTMSHEIRTPLNAIIGLTDVMLLQKPKGELMENLSILSFSANHLLSLINDVLDLAKIESGKIEFVNTPFNLEETIKRIYQTFKSKSNEAGIQFSCAVDNAIPNMVEGDTLRLTQIMNNLVNNAIKFTAKGSVKIKVKQINTSGKKVKLLFEVIDTGIGIDRKMQQRVFEDFVQADSNISRKYGGTGLGLAITKKLIELQGGTIHIESQPGKGSRFYFEMEFGVDAASRSKRADNRAQESTGLNNIKVLLVEDILANQKVAVSYLNHWGASVKCAENGKEALALFKKHDFDILLIDLYMPVMNGFECIEKIRKLPKGRTVPIIALTASIEPSVINKAVDSGADICLGKPFEAKQLLATIQKFTAVKPAPKVKAAAKPKVLAKSKFKHINLKRIEDASLGNKGFVAEMLQLLKTEIPSYVAECSDNLEKKDYKRFSASIHKLKNSLLMLGLDVLRNDLTKLEENSKAGKQLDKLPLLFAKVDAEWKKAEKELNSI